MISRSSRASILPRTCSPVVPVSPSINTLYFAANRLVVVDDFDEGANPNVLGTHNRIAAIESFIIIFSGMVCNYRIFVLFFFVSNVSYEKDLLYRGLFCKICARICVM
jgi:hypothetical protein